MHLINFFFISFSGYIRKFMENKYLKGSILQ